MGLIGDLLRRPKSIAFNLAIASVISRRKKALAELGVHSEAEEGKQKMAVHSALLEGILTELSQDEEQGG